MSEQKDAYAALVQTGREALREGGSGINSTYEEDARMVLDAVLPALVDLLQRELPHREWDEDEADSVEARSARAYNYALVKSRAVLIGAQRPAPSADYGQSP